MVPFFGGYGLYLLFSLPALLIGFWAQLKVRAATNKYSRVRSYNGWTGAQIARRILDLNGLNDVAVEQVGGWLSDHYDPTHRVLRLSSEVFQSNSLVAAGVAAHESGHALQDKAGYMPLRLRSAMVPVVQLGSWLGPAIFFVGLLLTSAFGENLAWGGLFLFGATALFAFVTLPVEFDASRRARTMLTDTGLIQSQELGGVNAVLDAAALTYVAAAIQAVSTLMYYAYILMGRRRD
ncbi:MAG: zinc metallopeptidase [Anaerolineaceae bacterium]|nr:zinc metallopeptidase [Anaerolineaceae bacterium]